MNGSEAEKKNYIRICKICHKEFSTAVMNQTVCDDCRNGTSPSHVCKECGKPIFYKRTFCSASCRSKYNNEHGVYNPFRDKEVQKKVHDDFNERMSSDSGFHQKVVKKSNDTRIQRYGSLKEAYSQRDKKNKETRLKRYGNEDYVNTDAIRRTCEERYGVSCSLNLPEVRKKAHKTCEERYGASCYSSTDAWKEKTMGTNRRRYGAEWYSSTEEGKKKIHDRNMELYGVSTYTQTEEYSRRSKKNHTDHIKEDGISAVSQEHLSEEMKSMLYDRAKSIAFLQSADWKINSLSERFGCSCTAVIHWLNRLDLRDYVEINTGSRYEDELFSLFGKDGFIRNQKILDGLEIDLYNPEKKLGIEFNGDYWHSDINKDRNYHFNKSRCAEEKGIHLIHIYEHEWNDPRVKPILISIIGLALGHVANRIYARKCEVREITNKEAEPFNNANHLQGHRNAQVTLGLFYQGTLVQLMSFSRTRYNRNLRGSDSWEIIRGCPGSNNQVIGGVSKLFTEFRRRYHPKSVFSYCDFNKFDGIGYERIGMRFIGYTGPDFVWLLPDRVAKRRPSSHSEMEKKAYARIWGAGSKKYLWEAEEEKQYNKKEDVLNGNS